MTDTESIGRTESTGRPGTPAGTANIGVVGMAVMGSNLARNLAGREGNTVVVYNRSPERTRTLVQEHPEAGFLASESIDDFVASLARPRTAIIMAAAPTRSSSSSPNASRPATSSSTAAMRTSTTPSDASTTSASRA
jgi:3-hydroxyisobutyrate dehydrogenase-like beta-hydroxyacid dehydrogenase